MPEVTANEIHASVVAQYQPIVDLNQNRMVGCEALARWRDSDGTLSDINHVVDDIEANEDLSHALTTRIFQCIKEDLDEYLVAHPSFYISVNIPPIVLGRARIRKVLEDVGLDKRAQQLVGEITERRALDDLGRSAIREARMVGARIAIDDFGTGNSGLQQLIGLEVDILKIDRSFVILLGQDRAAERLVRGIAALAAVLHVGLVAEGVETAEQALFLRAVGVDKGQGWLWSKAVSAAQLKQGIPGVGPPSP